MRNQLLTSAVVTLAVSAVAFIWGYWYQDSHSTGAIMESLFGSGPGATYQIAGWSLIVGALGFLIGVGLLIGGLVQSKHR